MVLMPASHSSYTTIEPRKYINAIQLSFAHQHPHPSDPQPPNLTTRKKTDIPTLLSADILALRLHEQLGHRMLWNV